MSHIPGVQKPSSQPTPPSNENNEGGILQQMFSSIIGPSPLAAYSQPIVTAQPGGTKRKVEVDLTTQQVVSTKIRRPPSPTVFFHKGVLKSVVHLPLSTPAYERDLINDSLDLIEDQILVLVNIKAVTQEQVNNLKKAIFDLVNGKYSFHETITDLALLTYYLDKDQKIPEDLNNLYKTFFLTLQAELATLERQSSQLNNPILSSTRDDYVVNKLIQLIVTSQGKWNRAGLLAAKLLLSEPLTLKLFCYEHTRQLHSVLECVSLDRDFEKELRSYQNKNVHPSLEWIVRCDLKLKHDVKIEFSHLLSVALKSLFTDLRQLNHEGNCYAVAAFNFILKNNPQKLIVEGIFHLQEGFLKEGQLVVPLTFLVAGFMDYEIIQEFSRNSDLYFFPSPYLDTVLKGLGIDSDQQKYITSFAELINVQQNHFPAFSLLDVFHLFSSYQFSYLQRLIINKFTFFENNNLYKCDFIQFLSNDSKYLKGKGFFLDRLMDAVERSFTLFTHSNKTAIESLMTDLRKKLDDSLWIFPLCKTPVLTTDFSLKMVKLDGTLLHPPLYHPDLFSESTLGLGFIQNGKVEIIYTFENFQNFLISLLNDKATNFNLSDKTVSDFLNFLHSDVLFVAFGETINNTLKDKNKSLQIDKKLMKDSTFVSLPEFGGSSINILTNKFSKPMKLHELQGKFNKIEDFLYYLKLFLEDESKKGKINNKSSYLVSSTGHAFLLEPHFLSWIGTRKVEEIKKTLDDCVLRSTKLFNHPISFHSASIFVKLIFGKDQSAHYLDKVYFDGITFYQFGRLVENYVSPAQFVDVINLLHSFFNKIPVTKQTLRDFLSVYQNKIEWPSHGKVDIYLLAESMFPYLQKLASSDSSLPLHVYVRGLEQAFLELGIRVFSPFDLEMELSSFFNLPLTLSLADLNYGASFPLRETNEHIRLGIAYNGCTEQFEFTQINSRRINFTSHYSLENFFKNLLLLSPS